MFHISCSVKSGAGAISTSPANEAGSVPRRAISRAKSSAIEVGCPVRILQGAQDPDVPWRHAFALAHRLPADDVVLTVIQDGDHRLSRPQDIARIIAAVAEIGPSGETP